MTVHPSPRMRLLGLSGSLRKASYSTAILNELKVALWGHAEIELADLRLPLYDQDEENAGPPRPYWRFGARLRMRTVS
jgi:chromate reductase